MKDVSLRCVSCGRSTNGTLSYRCDACSGVVELDISITRAMWDRVQPEPVAPSMWAYQSRLPFEGDDWISLGEGGTALLLAAPSVVDVEGTRVFLKDETSNPTGSFKDRLISLALSVALASGYEGIVCASTGNAGASAAAYAARVGVPCVVCVPASAPQSKLRQIEAYNPMFIAVRGNYSDAWALADALQQAGRLANVTTTYQNPYGVAALRTVAYELIDAMGGVVPDAIFVPTGSGPLVRGVLWGYEEALAVGAVNRLPKMVAVQADGCSPIVEAFAAGEAEVRPWGEPSTIAAGIADPLQGYPQDGSYTLAQVRKSGGWAVRVSDEALREAMRDLAQHAGVFAESSGAAGLAGLRTSFAEGLLAVPSTAVVLVTGSGFKDLGERPSVDATRIDFDPRSDSVAELSKVVGRLTKESH